MKESPTLADELVRRCFDKDAKRLFTLTSFRNQLITARRFVLDKAMSAFMADLAYASLPKRLEPVRTTALMEALRTAARLPHANTWIEYDHHERIKRANFYLPDKKIDPNVGPRRGGWLCTQHPTIETAFSVITCASDSIYHGVLEPIPQPNYFSWTWRTDDGPLPWKNIFQAGSQISEVLTGIGSYRSDQVGIIPSGCVDLALVKKHINVQEEMLENGSDIRYLWALLATINDLPVSQTHVTASKGYIARGAYRKFLDHTVITLTIPEKRARSVALRVVALSRKRAHIVRGHWRKDWRHEGTKIWIREHQRGDASLGFVTHDYVVERGTVETGPQ